MTDSGYVPGTPAISGPSGSSAPPDASLEDLKTDYRSFLSGKSEEIKEQKDARRYYHTSQWTAEQLKILKRRGQPPVTYNHEAKKINSVVGLLSRQRGDPKAYPRTPQQAGGAEVATACLRYTCDQQQWEFKNGKCTLNAAIDGISGVELELIEGDSGTPGDYEIAFNRVEGSSYFYDPRSLEDDFSDARFNGVSKWADIDAVVDLAPDLEKEIRAAVDSSGDELTTNPDSDAKWLMTDNGRKRARLVDHWYLKAGAWSWCLYIGALKLREGSSPFFDEKDKTINKFIMFSANIDQDGDRYGFHRNMKSSQDEINQRRGKALHTSSSRRIIVRDGQGLDVERIRREIVKPDGVIVIPPGAEIPQFDDVARAQELNAQLGFFQEAKAELESGQFNPEAVGNSEASISGRAIQLRQQAGIAELGPFLLSYRGWKLRLYRALWNAIRIYWKAERAIRVTDNPQSPQLIPINKLGLHPQTGQPAILNQVNALDVDIILDEGPDTITMQQGNADALAALGKSGVPIPPELALLLSDVDPTVKKQAMDLLKQQSQPGPLQQQAAMLDLQAKDLANKETASKIAVNQSKAGQHANSNDPNVAAALQWRETVFNGVVKLQVALIGAKSDAEAQQYSSEIDSLLQLAGLGSDHIMQMRDMAHERAMAQLQHTQQLTQQAAGVAGQSALQDQQTQGQSRLQTEAALQQPSQAQPQAAA